MELWCSLPHSQEIATCRCPEPLQPSTCPHPTSLRFILIFSLPSMLRSSWLVSFPQVSPLKLCIYLSSLPYVLNVPPNLVFFYWITQIIFDVCRDVKDARNVVFSTPLLLIPLSSNVIFSTLFSWSFCLYLSLNGNDRVLYPYKTSGTIIDCIFLPLCIHIAKWNTQDSAPNKASISRVHCPLNFYLLMEF